MKSVEIQKDFVKVLESKFSKKTQLADLISEALRIEKESAYRRLRCEVQFSLYEVVIIASKLNISLDGFLVRHRLRGVKNKKILELQGQSDEMEDKRMLMKNALHFYSNLLNQPYTESGLALTDLTYGLIAKYSYINRFYMMKYLHKKNTVLPYTTFEMIEESPEQVEFKYKMIDYITQIKYTYVVWDKNIIPNLINDINYYKEINLINKKDLNALKRELLLLMDELENLAITGKFSSTGNTFELYISYTHIDISYAYMWSEKIRQAMFYAFVFFATSTHDESSYQAIHDWVKATKRSSTLISGIGDKERILFFTKQRNYINTLE